MKKEEKIVGEAEQFVRNVERDHLRQIEANILDRGKWADNVRWQAKKTA